MFVVCLHVCAMCAYVCAACMKQCCYSRLWTDSSVITFILNPAVVARLLHESACPEGVCARDEQPAAGLQAAGRHREDHQPAEETHQQHHKEIE